MRGSTNSWPEASELLENLMVELQLNNPATESLVEEQRHESNSIGSVPSIEIRADPGSAS